MLTQENLPELLTALGFEKKGTIFKKTIGAAVIEVNTSKKEISYPEAAGLVINERQTCNFEANENLLFWNAYIVCWKRVTSQNTSSWNQNGSSGVVPAVAGQTF
jgi:hypothetical protein